MKLMDFFINLKVKDEGSKKALRDIGNEAGILGSKFEGLNSGAKKAGFALGAIALASAGFLKKVIDTSAVFEGFKVQLETLEGSSQKADQSLAWIKDFAAKTPYSMQQVTDSFIKLKAYGLDPIANNLMKDLGDMAGALGKPLEMAVEAMADAAQGEFERLKEFGIKAKKAHGEVTLTYQKDGKTLTKTVKNEAIAIQKAIQEIAQAKFGGGMEKQSKTWVGMLSNLGDAWDGFLVKVGETGIFDKAKEALADLLKWIDENKDTIEEFAPIVGVVLVGALAAVTVAIVSATVAMVALNLAFLANPITWIVIAVLALVAAVVLFLRWVWKLLPEWAKTWDGIKAKFQEVVDRIKAKIDELKARFPVLFAVISSFPWAGPFQPLINALSTAWDWMTKLSSWKMPDFSGLKFGGGMQFTPGGPGGGGTTSNPGGGMTFPKQSANSYTTNNVTVNAPNNSSPSRLASLTGRAVQTASTSGLA